MAGVVDHGQAPLPHLDHLQLGRQLLDLRLLVNDDKKKMFFALQYIHLRERTFEKHAAGDGVGDYVAGGRVFGTAMTLGVLF